MHYMLMILIYRAAHGLIYSFLLTHTAMSPLVIGVVAFIATGLVVGHVLRRI